MAAELIQTYAYSNNDSKSAYTLNGTMVTAEEAQAYLNKIMPMMIGFNGGLTNSPNSTTVVTHN